MKKTIIRIKGELPKYMTPDACAFDLSASGEWLIDLDNKKKKVIKESYTLESLERILIFTGIHMIIPKGYWGNIRDRSGLALKYGIHTLGGVIDSDYRGEIGVIAVNLSSRPYTIQKGERVAQMIIQPYAKASFEQVSEDISKLDTTKRGYEGFGHTGSK